MNWEEIYSDCPKAYNALTGFDSDEQIYQVDENYEVIAHVDGDVFNLRDLYDFFDGHNIFIVIDLREKIGLKGFQYTIWSNDHASGHTGDFPLRELAEEKAFARAFLLLEQQLA